MSCRDDYKKFLETLIDQQSSYVKDFVDNSTDTNVDFRIKMSAGSIQKLEQNTVDTGANGLEKYMKLVTTITTTNMHAFDCNEHLQLYSSPKHIIHDFIGHRIKLYQKRKTFIIEKLEKELKFMENRRRYICSLLDGTIDLRNKKKQVIVDILKSKFDVIDDDNEYKYLTKMPMDSVSEENVKDLQNKTKLKFDELSKIRNTNVNEMWLHDLLQMRSKIVS